MPLKLEERIQNLLSQFGCYCCSTEWKWGKMSNYCEQPKISNKKPSIGRALDLAQFGSYCCTIEWKWGKMNNIVNNQNFKQKNIHLQSIRFDTSSGRDVLDSIKYLLVFAKILYNWFDVMQKFKQFK